MPFALGEFVKSVTLYCPKCKSTVKVPKDMSSVFIMDFKCNDCKTPLEEAK